MTEQITNEQTAPVEPDKTQTGQAESEQTEQTETEPKIETFAENAVKNIFRRVASERQRLKDAKKKYERCNSHVSKLLGIVRDLPKKVTDLESELEDAIAEGKPVVKIEQKLTDVQAELDRTEKWLDDKSDEFLANAAEEQRIATNELRNAVQRCCDTTLETLNDRADKAMKELFEAFEDWRLVLESLSAVNLPRPMFRVPIHCGGFVSTIQTNREKLLRYKRMTDVFPADIARGKYIHQDRLFAERKAKEDAEARIVAGNEKRSVSMKAHFAKKNILNEGKAGEPDKDDKGYIDTGVTVEQARDIINTSLNETGLNEEKIRELTREAIAATTA